MNLVRLIILALAVWLAIRLLRRLLKPPAPRRSSAAGAAKDMVRCAGCGLHLPKPEAIAADGRYFCCEEHRRRSAGTQRQ